MRFYVTAVVLACVPLAIAQPSPMDTPAHSAPLMPSASVPRGQILQAMPAGSQPGTAKKPNVAPTAALVTLNGVCKPSQAKAACKTVITRAELDGYVNAFAPDVSETAEGRMAIQYAKTVAMAGMAEQQGLDKDPAVAKELALQLKLARLRVLSMAFMKKVHGQTMAAVPPVEVQHIYEENKSQYEEARIIRLSVPMEAPNDTGRPLDRATVKTELEALRNRALAGEDLNQLQAAAFKDLNIHATPPTLSVYPLRRAGLQGDEIKIFDLKPGEISPVLDLPASYAIVKLESKETMPMEQVRAEISDRLFRNRIQSAMETVTKGVTANFDLGYFGMTSQPDIFGPTPFAPLAGQARAHRLKAATRPN
jgi:hypothetical protein